MPVIQPSVFFGFFTRILWRFDIVLFYLPRSGKTLYLNTGLTSTLNWGDRILTTEADLVTAHELGHNFGADHDDDTETLIGTDCTPGQVDSIFVEFYCLFFVSKAVV